MSKHKDEPEEEKGMAYWEKQRRKLDQELKKTYEAQRKELAKDKKDLELDKKAVHNEWQRFLSEKKEIDFLTQKIELEKEQWLKHLSKNKKKKGPSEGPIYLTQITQKIKELAAKQQLKKDLEGQQDLWVQLKKEKSDLAKERKELRRDQKLLEKDRKEFEEISGALKKRRADCEKDEARLKEAKLSLNNDQKRVQERIKEYKNLTQSLKQRDKDVKARKLELKEKTDSLEGVKDQFKTSSQRQKREDLAKKFNSLASTALLWNTSFAELFKDFGEIPDKMRNKSGESGSAILEASKA